MNGDKIKFYTLEDLKIFNNYNDVIPNKKRKEVKSDEFVKENQMININIKKTAYNLTNEYYQKYITT